MKPKKEPEDVGIEFLPVCSACRAILDDYDVNFENKCVISTANDILSHPYDSWCITPPFCPHCKENFQYILLQIKLPFTGRDQTNE